MAVSLQQRRIGFDIDLFQHIQFGADGPLNLSFHFVAEMTARFGIENHSCFLGHTFLPDSLSGSDFRHNPLANSAAKDV